MHCKNCGKEVNGKFCSECGTPNDTETYSISENNQTYRNIDYINGIEVNFDSIIRKWGKNKINACKNLIDITGVNAQEAKKAIDKAYAIALPYMNELVPKKPWYKKFWVWAVLIILIFAFSPKGHDKNKTTSTGANENISVPIVSSIPTPEPSPTPKNYKSGQYKVGTDIPAGEYVLITKQSADAYFEITSDSTGQMNSIIANDNFTNRSIISVKEGQYLKFSYCTAYAFADAPKVEPVEGFISQGMYKVGTDIKAGEYKVVSDGDGYIEVSKNSSHSMNSIITNDNFEGEKYITISDGQYIKLSSAKIKIPQ